MFDPISCSENDAFVINVTYFFTERFEAVPSNYRPLGHSVGVKDSHGVRYPAIYFGPRNQKILPIHVLHLNQLAVG